MKKIEFRTFSKSLRAYDGGQAADPQFELRGLACRYNSLSGEIKGGFREKVLPGAFRSAVDGGQDVRCLFNHDDSKVLGRVKSGTLRLADTPEGLAFRCQLDPNNTEHRNLHASVKRGDIDACSWGFSIADGDDDFSDGYDDDGKRCVIRSIRNVSNLYDVSVVTHPAYPSTTVDARAARGFVDQLFRTNMTESYQEKFIREHDGFDPWLMDMRADRYALELRNENNRIARERSLELRLARQTEQIAKDNIDAAWKEWQR